MALPSQIQEAAIRANEFLDRGNPSNNVEPEIVVEPEAVEPEVAPLDEDWQKRFKNYKQGTDKTIHDLRQANAKAMKAEADNKIYQRQIEELKDQVPKTPSDALNLFSEDEVNTFIKLIADQTSATNERVEALTNELNTRKTKEVTESKKEAHDRMIVALTAAVPDFVSVDTNPAFRDYLEDVDSYGNLRMNLLRSAQANNDIAGLIKFYTDFKALPSNQIVETPNLKELQQVPPSIPTNEAAPQRKIWTRADIDDLYWRKSQGKVTTEEGNAEEADMIDFVSQFGAR